MGIGRLTRLLSSSSVNRDASDAIGVAAVRVYLATRRVSRIDDGRRTGVLWPDRVFGQDRYAGPEHY